MLNRADKNNMNIIKSDRSNNVYRTKLTVKDGNGTVTREDYFVTWGFFEDNILSQYSSFLSENSDQLISTFRSIENRFDENGNMAGKGSVLIRNNPTYLQPRDVFSFFLPGQNVSFEAIETNSAVSKGYLFWKEYTGYALDDDAQNHLKTFLNIRSEDATKFSIGDGKYGRLRNIMVNVKEIQKAFGIQTEKISERGYGKIYGSDIVTPVSNLKAGVNALLGALSDNFHNFWKFEIVEDNFSKNIKIIETNSTSNINSKRYTKFGTDENPDNNKVNKLGIYKFPSYTLGSMVKNQELSFTVPDSMAITAMYGSNKNETTGLVLDTSNESAEMETVFDMDKTRDQYKDQQLAGLDKAFKKSKGGVHKIGNVSSDPTQPLTTENGLVIDPNLSWWNRWSASAKGTITKPVDESKTTEEKAADTLRSSFAKEMGLILAGSEVNQQLAKEIDREIELLTQPEREYKSDGRTVTEKSKEAENKYNQARSELEARKPAQSITSKYYQFIEDDKLGEDFTMRLFTAGESILRTKLFQYDSKSSAYQSNFLIPADLQLSIDGIGGITPGDVIQTEYIQPKYNREIFTDANNDNTSLGPRTFFQIFGLTQNVSPQGWLTEIDTKMRMNNDVLAESAGEIKLVVELPDTFPEVKRPHIPVPSDDEDIADDLPLDELDFDDFSQMKGPPPPPPLIETDFSTVEAIFGCMDDRPPKPGSAGYSDVRGKNRFGDNWAGDEVEYLRNGGYLAQNYDPEAQIDGVSETDLTSPCIYDEEVPQQDETPDFEDDFMIDFYEDDIGPRPVFGCTDPKAINYAGIGYLGEIDRGEVIVVAHSDSPCQYPPKIEVPSDDEDIADDLVLDEVEFDDFSNMAPPPPPPKPGPPITILDTTKVEVPKIKKKKKKKIIEKKKLEDVKPTEESKKAQEQTGAPKDPPVLEGVTRGACTDEQIALGYKTVVGYVAGVDDGLNVNNPEIYGKFVEGVGGGGVSSQFCDARDPIPPKPKIEEKKTPPVILSAPKPTFLKSTYFGGYLQNSLILYKVTPWFARGSHIKPIIFYGGVPKAGPHKGNRERYYEDTNLKAVSYFIRQKFWDEMIEPPNETGGSIFANGAEFGDGGFDGANNLFDKVQSDLFLSTWTLPKYTKGAIDAEFLGQDTLIKAGATWTPQTGIACARYPVNGKVGTERGYGYSSDSSKQGEKILISDYLP